MEEGIVLLGKSSTRHLRMGLLPDAKNEVMRTHYELGSTIVEVNESGGGKWG